MINTILDELKGKILDLKFIERYGSIVVPVSQDVEDENGRSKRITFPASWDGQGKACYAANDYFELAPNDVYRSVSYWELRGDAVPFVPRRGDRGKWYGFRQSARLVVWLNLQVLGIPETGNKLSDHLSVLAMNALQGAHQVGVDYIDGVRMTVERKVRKSMDIFGPYSYSDRNELLLYPYDFFAIDFAVEWYIRRDCVPGEVPYKALKCAPIEMPGGGAWTPGGGDECNCRWIDIPDRPHRLSEFENDLPCAVQMVESLPAEPDGCVVYFFEGKYWQSGGLQEDYCFITDQLVQPFFGSFEEMPVPGNPNAISVVQLSPTELDLYYWVEDAYQPVYFDGVGNPPPEWTEGQYVYASLPAGTGLFQSCTKQQWNDITPVIDSVPWGVITDTPTNLEGYGVDEVEWEKITDTPTNLEGYGVDEVEWEKIEDIPVFLDDTEADDRIDFGKPYSLIGQRDVRVKPDPGFVSTWDSSYITSGSTANGQIALPLIPDGEYNFRVYYQGQLLKEITNPNDCIITFPDGGGIKEIVCHGKWVGFNRFHAINPNDMKLISADFSGGVVRFVSQERYFWGYQFLESVSGINWRDVTNLRLAFGSCLKLTNVGEMDVSKVTNMDYMFNQCTQFNQDLSGWCVENIPSKPSNFDNDTPAWVLPKPVWGTCP